MFPSKPGRRLHLEALEPRWTMDAQATSAAPSTADVQDVENSLNQFAIDLYQAISATNSASADNSNQPIDEAISPLSIAAALAMVYGGARGETASQLAQALHIDLPPERFHAAMGAILHDILPAASDSATELDIADAVWGQTGFPFLDSFRQLTHDQYGADFHEADFENDPGAATAAINDWVKNQTHDMIKKLFDSLSSNTRLVLANALYFKASWATAFDPVLTQRTVFHLASGSNMDVSMMQDTGFFKYTETSDYQIAELPYQGDRYSMLIVLPKQAGANLPVDFSAADLQSWLGALHSTDLALELPKFTLDSSMSLIDTLQSLGVTNAFFDTGLADFTGIDGARDLYISQAVHKAKVEVDETGTKAAAATGIGIGVSYGCMCSPPTPTPFYADHPFHFLILDHQTNSVLFLGQVQQPLAYEGDDSTSVDLPKIVIVQPPGTRPVTPPVQWPIGPTVVSPPVFLKFANRFDVNGDGQESAADALMVINYLNDHSSPASQAPQAGSAITAGNALDVDGDGIISPRDALRIINRLNQNSSDAGPALTAPGNDQAEGEAGTGEPSGFASAVDALLSLDDLAATSSRPATGRPT